MSINIIIIISKSVCKLKRMQLTRGCVLVVNGEKDTVKGNKRMSTTNSTLAIKLIANTIPFSYK